ncbi:MAG: pyruvate:ferredoxin (flavodoxin) oxidoreductase [Planctomycetota bacterium]
MTRRMVTIDGNEAAAYVAHRTNEVIAIYPITPSSGMGEMSDEWSARGQKNIWGTIPSVVEMQSEGGAAGAVHGALQSGALTTTFTASQGLLLMIPNMFKIAGELTPTVFHVTARSVATHALSIFGDHSDVMAARATGFALLASGNNQEIMDFALCSQAATLASRVPMIHFFDGFRSSHEVSKVEQLTEDDLRAMLDDELIGAHRDRSMSPEKPVLRGTAQNPDVFFQARETVTPFYAAAPGIMQKAFDRFADLTGRSYHLFDYFGAPDAERVVIMMGSGAEAAHELVDHLVEKGEKVGLLKVRLYRPFATEAFLAALPETVNAIAVLDRTKEPGADGEPLFKDVVAALAQNGRIVPKLIGGRYGLSSKEFTPAMVKGVYDELQKDAPKNDFTIGIVDDVSNTSLDYDPEFSTEGDDVVRAMFYGLGSDGTVGANKNSIKIIGEETDNFAQGYFVYDSKKAGAVTVSHLRFGPRPIRSSYLVSKANFVACHQFSFLEKYDMLKNAVPGATFLLNSPFGPDEIWGQLPRPVQEAIIDKGLKFFVIDGYEVAKESGMGARVNTIMQACFFAISGVLERDEAIAQIKKAIEKSYGMKGEDVVRKNFEAVDHSLANLHEVAVPAEATSTIEMPPTVPGEAPEFVKEFTAEIIAGRGDDLPVSAFPVDGTFPTGTTQWEKRNIALEIPVWDEDVCIQCGKCAMVCPHAAIRSKVYDPAELESAPAAFKSVDFKSKDYEGLSYTIQTAPEDCTGCELCVEVCPAKNKKQPKFKAINMQPQRPLREAERENYAFFLDLPEFDRKVLKMSTVKNSQLLQPLFEYSGACSGCGETPYVKLLSQLFGDRTMIANATGCSSIYGGNLPTTPWSQDANGRGPTWSNSLFEDNAEFGFGFRLTVDKLSEYAKEMVREVAPQIGDELANGILDADQTTETGLWEQRQRVAALKEKLGGLTNGGADVAKRLLPVADYLIRRSIWIKGGDGWAYDIGYGGLDHVLAMGRDVNVIVLDTEVYSNTGGQMSKATPLGAVAKFAAGGKPTPKKDLAMLAMSYGNVYVARVAMGARDAHTVKAFLEAESYPGASLIIAYSHCIAHGIDMKKGLEEQKKAVDCGLWPLLRYDPRRADEGKNPLQLDSKKPKMAVRDYAYGQNRFKMLTKAMPEQAERLIQASQEDVTARFRLYETLAAEWPQDDE